MTIQTIEENGMVIAVAESDGVQITDAQSALDLIATVEYESGSKRIVLDKEALDDRFFVLSSGLAGEVLQKFVNYRTRLAVVGDFSKYKSGPLHDFIYESNNGREVFFVATREEAVRRLSRA